MATRTCYKLSEKSINHQKQIHLTINNPIQYLITKTKKILFQLD